MWKEDYPVDISSEVKMPQFEISNVVAAKCQETFHIGELYVQQVVNTYIQEVDV